MKKSFIIFACILTSMLAASCSSTKSAKTYTTPCSDCLRVEDAVRVWASGTSNNETTARKKAMMSASAELAAVLEKNVETVAEEYTAALNDGTEGISKSFLNEQCKITVKKTISGANVICDKWVKNENGQYTNYIVLELGYKFFIDAIIEEANSKSDSKLNRDLLLELVKKSSKENTK